MSARSHIKTHSACMIPMDIMAGKTRAEIEALEFNGCYLIDLWGAYTNRPNGEWRGSWRVSYEHLVAVLRAPRRSKPWVKRFLVAAMEVDQSITVDFNDKAHQAVIHWGRFHEFYGIDETEPATEKQNQEPVSDTVDTEFAQTSCKNNPGNTAKVLPLNGNCKSPPSGESTRVRARPPSDAARKKRAVPAAVLPEAIEQALDETFGEVRERFSDGDAREFLAAMLARGEAADAIEAVIRTWATPQERGPARNLKNLMLHWPDRLSLVQSRRAGEGGAGKTPAGAARKTPAAAGCPACVDCGTTAPLRWPEHGDVHLCGDCADERDLTAHEAQNRQRALPAGKEATA